MNAPQRDDESEARLAKALVEYHRGGTPVDRQRFLDEHAEVADQLQAHWEMDDRLAALAKSPGLDPPPTPTSKPELEKIGRYRVVKTLGIGSFGTVYLAHDDELDRSVAIKVPHRYRVTSPDDVESYLAEARVVAGLDHPGIVPVYDVGGTDDGRCYVVSKFVEGSNLAARIRHSRPSHGESADLVATIAEALHCAHLQCLVHRDVKPANILMDCTGKPFVADFGLALKEEDFGKRAGVRGTPAYMSPEQARGESHLVDGRSDIFSLGVVFYELLTGRRPFVADDPDELLKRIKNVDARPPRQLDDLIPPELERICLKALSKRAADRYNTARDMAEDLRHWAAKRESEPKQAASADVPVSVPPDRPMRIVPKGLRSFDRHDADFFLGLLPGPYDRDGLPESIRFWKTAIDATDPDETFRVGVIYGPSGCGKSSLVKAGLLPRLGEHVVHVYVEATPERTEIQLLRRLQKAFPELADSGSLIDCLAQLRRGRGIDWDTKVLVVLDQFEQWLHSTHDYGASELAQALRQCDGRHVQCIVMVRDDFWMALTRFMRELEVPLVEHENSAPVDLFELTHARHVLAEFGRAYGCLPANLAETTREQSQFLTDAVEAAAEEGRVIAVRVSLFAEMVKGRPWRPSTLQELGGEEGIRLKFLEETFSAAHAPPEHRLHEKAIRLVLSCLLPDEEHELKGSMRSREELLRASGYVNREGDFEEVLQILNGLHLITPTDPEGVSATESDSGIPGTPGEKHYQLTHDYLVPSLREWLHRKRRETRRGRAELLLEERTRQWSRSQENRLLPSFLECTSIALHTPWARWTNRQREMLGQALLMHARELAVGAIGIALVAALTLATWNAYFRPADQWELLETFANDEATPDERITAFNKLNLDNSFVLLSALNIVREIEDPAVVGHALSRLRQLAADTAEFKDARIRGSFRDELIELSLVLLEQGTDEIEAEAFRVLSALAPLGQVVEEIEKHADCGSGQLADVMRDYLDKMTLAEMSKEDRCRTLRAFNAMIKNDWNNPEVVWVCFTKLDRMKPDDLIPMLVEAYESYQDIDKAEEDGMLAYLVKADQKRVELIGRYVEDRLVMLVRQHHGTVRYSFELEFLIGALVQIQPLSHSRYDSAFATVHWILENRERLDDDSILATAIKAFVCLKPPDSEVSLKPIREIMCNEQQEQAIRIEAAKALGDLNDLESIPELQNYATDRTPPSFLNLQVQAIESLTELGEWLKERESSSAESDEILATLRSLLDAYREEPRNVVTAVLKGCDVLGSADDVEALFPLLSETAYNIAAIKAVLGILMREPQTAQVVVPRYLNWRAGVLTVRGVDSTDSALTGFYSFFIREDSPDEDLAKVESAAKSVLEALAEARAQGESESIRHHAERLMLSLLSATDAPKISPDADAETRRTQLQEWRQWWQNERGGFHLAGPQLSRAEKGS